MPPNFHAHFPNELKPKTAVILAEAVRKFPTQTQTFDLCKHVISEVTPLFCDAVRDGTIKRHEVLSDCGMGGLLHSLLVYNDDGPHSGFSSLSDKGYRLEQEIRRSSEWLELAKEVANAQLTVKQEHSGDPSKDGAKTLPFVPHMPLSNPLTAHDAGVSATIDVESFVMALPEKNVDVCSGAITGLGYQTLYQVFLDDLHLATTEDAIVPTYNASVSRITGGIGGRFFVGSITTPIQGEPPTVGNGDGGTPHNVLNPFGKPKLVTTHRAREKHPADQTITSESPEPSRRHYPTRLGRNIDRFRKDCGWSYDELSTKTGIDKKLIRFHVSKGTNPTPRTVKLYADAFTRELKRTITALDLEQ